jgi:hypothetical protein
MSACVRVQMCVACPCFHTRLHIDDRICIPTLERHILHKIHMKHRMGTHLAAPSCFPQQDFLPSQNHRMRGPSGNVGKSNQHMVPVRKALKSWYLCCSCGAQVRARQRGRRGEKTCANSRNSSSVSPHFSAPLADFLYLW